PHVHLPLILKGARKAGGLPRLGSRTHTFGSTLKEAPDPDTARHFPCSGWNVNSGGGTFGGSRNATTKRTSAMRPRRISAPRHRAAGAIRGDIGVLLVNRACLRRAVSTTARSIGGGPRRR